MIQIDMKALLGKLNTFCTQTLHGAAGYCVSRTHYEVTLEHVFTKCLEDTNSDLPFILRKFEIDPSPVLLALNDILEELKTGNGGRPVFSPLLIDLLETAWLIASVDFGESHIRSGHILLAFLSKPSFFASGLYTSQLETINVRSLREEFYQIVAESSETSMTTTSNTAQTSPRSGEESCLERFCQDFTAKAREGGIDPVFGRDAEMRQMVDILARRRKNNPILVGEPGVGKTAVVEGLALRIAEGDVPEVLQDVTLLSLDMGLLEAGAGMKGEFESRLKGVVDEIKASTKHIILFIDEAHTLVGAGGQAGGSDAANLLKPALARGELRTCAATTWNEYKKYFEKDPALARRFQPVTLEEPSVETSALILRGLRDSYEKSHDVIIQDDAIQLAAQFSDRYITGRFLPDKAIDLLDTSCARVKVNLSAKPATLEDLERSIQALEREKHALIRDCDNGVSIDEKRLTEINDSITHKTDEAEALLARWKKEKEAAHAVLNVRTRIKEAKEANTDLEVLQNELNAAIKKLEEARSDEPLVQLEVNPDVVAKVVADWTGIPVGKVARDQAALMKDLETKLKDRIMGQDDALHGIAQVIKAAKAGIKNPDQPLGVFLLAGPSGVGKTETALTVADLLFGDERNVVTINMSEFQEKHTVSRLIGSPPGYVGYGEGGMLTEAVRQRPYSVVLLDEVEKAHLDVMNTFYQVFDKGILTDGEGKEINFRNTIIMLTSNLASDVLQEMTQNGAPIPADTLMQAVRPILSDHFKPALLARMTVLPYRSLNPESMKQIVTLKLNKLAKTLRTSNKMELSYSDATIDQIVSRCTEVETGARNIEQILNGSVLPRMAEEILSHMAADGMPASVSLDVDADGAFTMQFEKE